MSGCSALPAAQAPRKGCSAQVGGYPDKRVGERVQLVRVEVSSPVERNVEVAQQPSHMRRFLLAPAQQPVHPVYGPLGVACVLCYCVCLSAKRVYSTLAQLRNRNLRFPLDG